MWEEEGEEEDSVEGLLTENLPAGKRRNSSMAYLGPPVQRRGSLFQAAKAQPTKFEQMRARRQSVAV